MSIVGSRANDNWEMKVEGDSSARILWLAKSTSLRQYGTCFLSCFPPRDRGDLPCAAELGASEATVKMHRSQAMKKMQAKSLPELVRMADKLKSIT